MTIIDQRILIPANADVVWALLSDLASNPKWQVDSRSVSFLTSLREGPGTRWRTTHANGQESVQEITVWYDGLGYEYTYVDGAPFRESKGRIRLQEIAEGTIVQWTFTYEMPGVIGSLRNSLSTKRQLEGSLVDSLKGLWRHINQSGGSQQFHEAKSLMRDQLDYEQRAQYKPRHKLVGSTEPPQAPKREIAPNPIIDEPPISDEDTKPRQPVALPIAEPVEVPPIADDPDFLFRPATLQPADPPMEPVLNLPPVNFEPIPEPVVKQTPEPPKFAAPEKMETTEIRAILDTSEMDTAKVSIWDVFGVPRPSETQQMRAIQLEAEEKSTEEIAEVTQPAVEPEIAQVTELAPVIEAPLPSTVETAAIEYPVSTEPPKVPEIVVDEPVHAEIEPVVVAQPASITYSEKAAPTRIGLRIIQRRKLVKVRRVE